MRTKYFRSLEVLVALLLAAGAQAGTTPRGDLVRIHWAEEDEVTISGTNDDVILISLHCSPIVDDRHHAFEVDFVGLETPSGTIALRAMQADGFPVSPDPNLFNPGERLGIVPLIYPRVGATRYVTIRYEHAALAPQSMRVVATGKMPRDCEVEIEAAD